MELLTTQEAARYLRLKERKLYELVAAQAVPCTKVTGRWLFPRTDLDQWVAAGLVRPEGLPRLDSMPIMGGSHDPLLEWCLRESGSNLAMLNEGSEAGLARFCKGEIVATALHFHEMSDDDIDANILAVRREPGLQDVVLIAFAKREQGLLLAPGNPKRLDGLADVLATGARVALRQQGAGAQQLLLELCSGRREQLSTNWFAKGVSVLRGRMLHKPFAPAARIAALPRARSPVRLDWISSRFFGNASICSCGNAIIFANLYSN